MAVESSVEPKSSESLATKIPLGILGAIAGGAVGFVLFRWLHSFGLYAFVLPGALAGLGCGFAAKSRLIIFSFIALVFGLIATVLAEWHTNWFADDETLLYFVKNIHESRGGMALVSILLNCVAAFWLGRRG